jgi:spore coat protein B
MNKVLMSSMVGKVVNINRGGPEARTGLLLSAGEDYFVLQTKEEGVLYITSRHVNSISENTKQGIDFDRNVSESLVWSRAADFTSMLGDLKHQWVTINRGDPEKIEGVLDDANDDYITLILNEEVIHLASYYVKSVAILDKKSSSDNKSNNSSKNSKNSNKKVGKNTNRYYYEIEALNI